MKCQCISCMMTGEGFQYWGVPSTLCRVHGVHIDHKTEIYACPDFKPNYEWLSARSAALEAQLAAMREVLIAAREYMQSHLDFAYEERLYESIIAALDTDRRVAE